MRRFQIYQNWHFGRSARAYELNNLRKLDWHCAAQFRDLYNNLLGGGGSRLTDRQLLDWLRREAQSTTLAAFWLQDVWTLGTDVMAPAASPAPPPVAMPVAQWTIRHKIIAMFQTVPAHLGAAARAQFEAFITRQNLALLAGIFVVVAAVQAVPGADNGAGGVDEGKLLMTGGGSQVSLPPSAVSFGNRGACP